MEVSNLSPLLPGPVLQQDDTDAENSRATAAADFDSFLTLLTAQLRNQDPLSPLDSTEFIAQLASFSSVEQIIGTNERLDALTAQSLTGEIAGFASWIGRSVAAIDGSFRANGQEVSFPVPGIPGADRVDAEVVDSAGRLVRAFSFLPGEGETATWDGRDTAGRQVSGLDASINLKFFDEGIEIAAMPAEVRRQVVGVRGTENGPILDLTDGGSIAPERVGRLELISQS